MSKPQNKILDDIFETALNDAVARKELAVQLRDTCLALGPQRFKAGIEQQLSSMPAQDALAVGRGISDITEILKQIPNL
jgi:hypothetical protein